MSEGGRDMMFSEQEMKVMLDVMEERQSINSDERDATADDYNLPYRGVRWNGERLRQKFS